MDTSDALKLPDETVETIRLQIEHFLSKLTIEQWNLLKSETPDNATKHLLAELLLLMTSSVSLDLIRAHGHDLPLITESLQSSLGDALRQSFAQGSLTNSVRLDELTGLVAEEMIERVNYFLSENSTRAHSAGPPQFPRPTPNKLERMVCCVCKVLRKFSARIEGSFQLKLGSQSPFELMHELLQGIISSSDSYSSPNSFRSDRSTTSESTLSSSLLNKSGTVTKIILKEVSEIMVPLVDEMSEADVSELILESSLEFKATSDEISQIISEEKRVTSSELSSISKSSEDTRICKGVEKKIMKILAKFFATASMVKMGAQVKKEFEKKTKVQSRESMKFLMASVEYLLLTETKFRVLPEKAPVLTDVLYRYVTAEILVVTPDAAMTVSVPKSHRRMYGNIQERVFNALPLMNWWFSKQAGDYTNRMTSTVMEIKSTRDLAETRKKMFVSLILVQLVARVNVKSKVNLSYGNPTELAHNLFKKTWAEVKDIDFEISSEIINNLHKPVFKELCKKWAGPEMLLLCISNREPEVEKNIIDCIKTYMSKKPNRISRIISSVAAFFKL
nr:PREDICTED: uncharacterized protein LOC109640503 [Paralichthys olivaceus]